MLLCVLSLLLPTNWIVDAANGPGTDFTNLPAAIAAASSGDTIFVRAGAYSGVVISGKALSIRGAGAGTTIVGPSSVNGTPPGASTVISGLTLGGAGNGLAVAGAANVLLLECTVTGGAAPTDGHHGLLVTGPAQVAGVGCTLRGGDALAPGSPFIFTSTGGAGVSVSQGGRFAADRCVLRGGDNLSTTSAITRAGGPGLLCFAANARLDGCQTTGGNGITSGGNAVNCLAEGLVRLAGTAPSSASGGLDGNSAQALTLHAYQANLGIVVHQGVSVSGSSAGPLLLGAPELPRLAVAGTMLPSGETDSTQLVTVTLAGLLPLEPFWLLVGLRPLYTPEFPPLAGDLLIDLGTAGWLPGVLDGSGQFQFAFVPDQLFGSGLPFPILLQSVVLDSVAGALRLSNVDARLYSP